MKTPTLKFIDLDLCTTEPGKHGNGLVQWHPDIVAGYPKMYLARIGGLYFAGRFSKQWYGYNFQGWYGVGLQLDKPGTNSSRWEGLWEIVEEDSDSGTKSLSEFIGAAPDLTGGLSADEFVEKMREKPRLNYRRREEA